MLVIALLVLTGNIAVSVLAFQGLIGFSGQGADLSIFSDVYFWGVLSFSVKQAVLSAVLSVLLAWPVARGCISCLHCGASNLFFSFVCWHL
ncbi:hypothetical protein [Aliamphritea spongicola]|nr:hypothetical protein [Aliamphritea spongicola]